MNQSSGANIEGLWKSALMEAQPNPSGAAGALMRALGSLLDVDLVEFGQVEDAALFLLDLSSLGFKGMDLNVVMITHPPVNEEEVAKFAHLMDDYKYAAQSIGFCFHIILQNEPVSHGLVLPDYLEIVSITYEDLHRLFTSKLPTAVLFELIRRQVHIHQLCPFNTTREARGSMFRGRKAELRRLTAELDTHFIISGARRIGKTSLLMRAYNTLRVRPEMKDRVFYFDCSVWGNFYDCAHRLAHAIELKKELRIDEGPRNLSYLLERASMKGRRRFVFFFDEFDRVCEIDRARNWPLMRLLHEAASYKYVRLVFAGYRSVGTLQNAWRGLTSSSPFHASLNPLTLEPLDEEEARGLLCDPFRTVGIQMRDQRAIAKSVYESSAGYPFFVQFVGERLFLRAVSREPEEVLPEDCEAVNNSFELNDFLISHFLQNTIDSGQSQVYERALAFVYAHSGCNDGWTPQQFLTAMSEHGHELDLIAVQDALRNLHSSCVFTYTNRRYKFTFPLLGEVLRESYPNLDLILKAV